VRVESKVAGSLSRSVRAVSTSAAVPLMAVRDEPSRVPEPLAELMEVMSVALATPERVLLTTPKLLNPLSV